MGLVHTFMKPMKASFEEKPYLTVLPSGEKLVVTSVTTCWVTGRIFVSYKDATWEVVMP
jgi:hypothetical protein